MGGNLQHLPVPHAIPISKDSIKLIKAVHFFNTLYFLLAKTIKCFKLSSDKALLFLIRPNLYPARIGLSSLLPCLPPTRSWSRYRRKRVEEKENKNPFFYFVIFTTYQFLKT